MTYSQNIIHCLYTQLEGNNKLNINESNLLPSGDMTVIALKILNKV